MTWLPPYKRNVNTVFQNYALFPHLTIYENVAFGLRRKGVKDAEIKARVAEMLKLVELPGYEQRKPTQISGGQAQRVALARALINRPAVLLLDEPLGALDLKLRKQMQVELKRIQQEVGITFIYVTHDQEEAMTMSDRIAVMNRGRYEQLGDPESLYERPTTRFVAGFLGISNLLPGDVEGERRQLRDRPPRRRHPHPGAARRSSTASARRASASGPRRSGSARTAASIAGGHNDLSGVVRDASYLGVSTQYQIEARGGATLTVYEQNVERATRPNSGRPGRRSADVVTRPQLRRPRTSRARRAGARPDRTPRRPPVGPREETHDRSRDARPPTDRAAASSRASALTGVAAFVAACGTGGTGSARRPRRPRRRRERGGAAAVRGGAGRVAVGRAQLRQLAAATSTPTTTTDQAQDARGLHGQVRHGGQLLGGDQRQRRVLRHDPAGARRRPGHRLGHRRV